MNGARRVQRAASSSPSRRQWPRLIVGAVLGGVAAGVAGDLLVLLLRAVQWVATGEIETETHLGVEGVPGWRVITAAVVGGLIIGTIWWQLRSRVHMIDMEHGIHDPAQRMPLAATWADAALQVTAVGAGASVGREAAPRQAAAAAAQRVASWLRLTRDRQVIVVGAAAAAGLAAVYNVPFTGLLYAVEVVGLALSLEAAVAAMIASGIAAVVCWPTVGAHASYDFPPVHVHLVDAVVTLVLLPGALLVGAGFLRVTGAAKKHRLRAGPWSGPGAAAAMGLVAVLALQFRMLPGNGKSQVQELFTRATPALWVLLVLVALKPVVTGLCLASGLSGGVIAPSLATGAALGGAVAAVVGHGASVPIAVVVGAAGVLAVTQRAPLMAGAFGIELTHPAPLCALLVAALCASIFVGSRVQHWRRAADPDPFE